MSRLILDQESGQWVNEKYQHIAEIINDWDSRLRLLWVPENLRNPRDEYPYAVGFFENEFSEPHIILFVKEEELDARIIAKLFDMRDAAKDPQARLDNLQRAEAIIREKANMEWREEQMEMAKTLIKSPLHRYRMRKGQVYDL